MNRYVGYSKLTGQESMRLLDELEVPTNFYTLYILRRVKNIRFNYLYQLLGHALPRVSKVQLRWHLARLETHHIIMKINHRGDFYLLNPKYAFVLTDLYRGNLDNGIYQLTYALEKTYHA